MARRNVYITRCSELRTQLYTASTHSFNKYTHLMIECVEAEENLSEQQAY